MNTTTTTTLYRAPQSFVGPIAHGLHSAMARGEAAAHHATTNDDVTLCGLTVAEVPGVFASVLLGLRCPRCVREAAAMARYPRVLDDSQRNQLPTGRVTVTAPAGFSDRDLAQVAGFNSSHFGVDVTRYDDGTALVSLWND